MGSHLAPVPVPAEWAKLPLTPEHVKKLEEAAISPDVARTHGVRSITTTADLPAEFAGWGEKAVPSLLFPWVTPSGDVVHQLRLDNEVTDSEGKPVHYLFPKGSGSNIGVIRDQPTGPVYFIEGTKQSLAGVEAIADGAIYAVAGCRTWSTDGVPESDLGVVEDRDVFIIFDADVETNPDVWEAADKFAKALRAEGATSVKHVILPGGRKTGLDDLLGKRSVDKREPYLRRIVAEALPKLKKKPTKKAAKDAQLAVPDTSGRPLVTVSNDRKHVIDAITNAMKTRWDGTVMFDYGDVIASRNGARMLPLERDKFIDVVHKAVRCVSESPTGSVSASEPSAQVLSAVMSRASSYTRLDHLATVPFVRPDGTICSTEGYDAATKTFLAEPLDVVVPETPTPAEVEAAMSYLRDDWLVDFMPSLPTDADKANALGLMITPTVRGMVPIVPLAIVNGLQMGVGKNLLADLLSIIVTGHSTAPLPYNSNDDENRKVILAAFRQGRDLFIFDEAHTIEGAALARALTSHTYSDRILGVSTQVEYPNNVTWVSLGNNVQVNGDMARRVYQIRVAPKGSSPENRNVDSFVHPEIRDWTLENRAHIVSAILTLVRAWFVAGKPQSATGRAFGSYDTWGGMVGGILENAGVHGFVSNLAEFRSENDYTTRYWTEHLSWLGRHWTPGTIFTVSEVVAKMRASGAATIEHPPGLEDHTSKDYPRLLGQAYGRANGVSRDGLKIERVSSSASHGNKWTVVSDAGRDDFDTPGNEEGPDGPPAGEPGGSGGMPPATCVENFSPLDDVRVITQAAAPTPHDPPIPHTGTLAVDLESASVEELFARSDFIRLSGFSLDDGPVTTTTDAQAVRVAVESAETVIGHNVMGFDLIALAHHTGLDIHALVERDAVIDTKLVAFLNDPPPARMVSGQIEKHYSLDSVGKRLVNSEKNGDLKALAKEFGGFDAIPVDDERYLAYLEQDVLLTAKLAKVLPVSDYARREHRVAALAAQITLNGFRVDPTLLRERLEAGQATRARLLGVLQTEHGLPTTRKDGKPSASPQSTAEGKKAIKRAFEAVGAPHMPKTPSGEWATGKEAMEKMVEVYADKPEVVALCEVIQELNGVRSIYSTVTDNLIGDRVHPHIDMRQVTGRWSITRPGLTVMGKRGERWREREIFLPEQGHVLIAADLSQIDARAIAAHSQDPAYLELFELGTDSHVEVAKMVWGDPTRRHDAKAIGHGWNYGMGIEGLARNAKVAPEVALQFDTTMREAFPGLVEWRDRVREQAAAGDVLDNGFGRLMRPDPERAWTQGPALMGQGCARDLLMAGMLALPAYVRPMLRAVVHDEVVFSVPVEQVEQVEADVLTAMEFEWTPPGGTLAVKITAGFSERGSTWGAVYHA